METPKRYRLWLVGTTLGILLALLLAPVTRWLVWTQLDLTLPRQSSVAPLRYLFTKSSDADNAYVEQQLRQAVAHHPSDLPVQLAAALMTPTPLGTSPGSVISVARLRALEARFPDSPALRAASLRFAGQNIIRIDRDDEVTKALGGTYVPFKGKSNPLLDAPDQLAAFDADAAAGEQLDPDNAYFPLMRAAGLFAAHQDAEALDALQRAARKSRWEEYFTDEVDGRLRLQEEAFDDYGATARAASYAAVLLPHYALLRAAARMALTKAVEAEKAGQAEEGLRIRDAVLQCASRMRVQSHLLIGSLVGIAIERIVTTHPGGAPTMKFKGAVSVERRRALTLQAYDDWLRQIGHPEESERVHAEMEAGLQASEISRVAINSNAYVVGPPLVRLGGWWVAGLLTLSNGLWMLALAGVATLLARVRRLRAGLPLPHYAHWNSILGLIAGVILTIGLLFPQWVVDRSVAAGYLFPGTPWPSLGLAVLVLGTLALTLSGFRWRERLYGLGIFALSGLGVLLLIPLFTWQAEGVRTFLSFFPMFFNLSEGSSPQPSPLAWVPCLTLAVPVLTALILGGLSLIYRVPLSAGLVRGLRGIAIPTACILFLVYSSIVVVTLRQEAIIQSGLTRQMQHEGRYLAQIAGKEWPR